MTILLCLLDLHHPSYVIKTTTMTMLTTTTTTFQCRKGRLPIRVTISRPILTGVSY